jgi:protein-tyrosine phosphatase
MDYHRILAKLYVGSYPEQADDIRLLKREAGITAVLNLQTDDDMRHFKLNWDELLLHYKNSDIDVRRVSVRDFDPDDLRTKLPTCVATLDQLLQSGHRVYLHCSAGAGRSPTVAIAYLSWCCGWELNKAIGHVMECRPCSPCLEAISLAAVRVERPRRA